MKTRFQFLAIGEHFHTGKSKGAGARSHITSWEVCEKIDRTRGRVVEVYGGRNSIGAVYAFSANSTVFQE